MNIFACTLTHIFDRISAVITHNKWRYLLFVFFQNAYFITFTTKYIAANKAPHATSNDDNFRWFHFQLVNCF